MDKFCLVRSIFLVIAALFLASCSPWPSPDESEHLEIVDSRTPIPHVQGFEIRYAGLNPKEMPFFDVGYAIWANYPYFTYAGDTYERAGVGGVVIRRHVVRPTRYLVLETVRKVNPLGEAIESTFVIIDKDKHVVVAHRILREGETENQTGWVGQHAAEFVRRNLLTDVPVGIGGVGTKVYPRFPVKSEPLQIGSISDHGSGCGSTISKSTHKTPATLDTSQWQFLPQAPLSDFACSDGYILVLSNIYPNDLFLDVLTEDGTYVFQTEILGPASLDPEGVYVKLDDVKLSNSSAEFNLITSRAVHKGNTTERHPEHYVHVHMLIKSHSVQ